MITCFDIANYFLWFSNSKNQAIDSLKLQKLTFFAQSWHLALYKEPLFEEDFQAWRYGPVIPAMYSQYSRFGKKPIQLTVTKPALDPTVENFLNFICEEFLLKHSPILSGITHKKDSPWSQIRQEEGCSSQDNCTAIIPKSLLQEYYSELINDDELNEDYPLLEEFLDLLDKSIEKDFSNCLLYTSEMLAKDKELLASILG